MIASFGDKLWKELVGTGGSTPFKITNVQLSFSGIGIMEAGQRTIEGFLASRNSSDNQQTTAPGVDDSEDASRLRSSTSNILSTDAPQFPKKRKRTEDDMEPKTATQVPLDDQRVSFVCEKCGKRIWLDNLPALAGVKSDSAHDASLGDTGSAIQSGGAIDAVGGLDDEIREDALAALRLEHADFHFAQELAAAGDESAPKRVIRPSDRPSTTAKKRKQQKKPAADEGIARFFQKR